MRPYWPLSCVRTFLAVACVHVCVCARACVGVWVCMCLCGWVGVSEREHLLAIILSIDSTGGSEDEFAMSGPLAQGLLHLTRVVRVGALW